MELERSKAILLSARGGFVSNGDTVKAIDMAIEALIEKQERDKVKQWVNDMSNPLEPLKVESALRSEIMKMNFRIENKKEISVLDYTIMAVLAKELRITYPS